MQFELLIDGAIPRTSAERVSLLLGVAESEIARHYTMDTWDEFPHELYKRNFTLHQEYSAAHADSELSSQYYALEFWRDLENDVIELITDLLPAGWYCGFVEDYPDTVAIMEMEEDNDGP